MHVNDILNDCRIMLKLHKLSDIMLLNECTVSVTL